MIINKIFDVKLDIDNVNVIFVKNINEVIFELIEKQYINKCFLGVYILKINKILNRSVIEIDQSNLEGLMGVCIQFEATCITFSFREPIMDVTLKKIINNNMSLTNDYCNAFIKTDKIIPNYNKDQKIIIRVGKAKFDPGSNKIDINAYPFIPVIDKQMFYKLDNISKDVKEKLHEIKNNIDIEEKRKIDILKGKNKWEYFDKLVHPYNKDITKDVIKKNVTEDILNIDKLENTIVSFDSNINMSTRLICKYESIDSYVECDSFEILYDMYKTYYLHLKLINDLATIYNDDKIIDDNKNLFELYIKYKK